MASKDAALREIASVAKRSEVLRDVSKEEILAALNGRKELGSTGFGKGVAIPHCRMESVPDFVVGFLSVPDGVDFDAADGEPVRLIAFIVAPQRSTNEHIQLLSAISRALNAPGAVEAMVATNSPQVLLENFVRHTHDELTVQDRGSKCIFHVLVQDETLFREVLQVLSGIGDSSALVIEGENTGVYLAKMPLFSGFWHDQPQAFCRIIVAVIHQNLANEAIRAIEAVSGNLNDRSDVMVMVQDLRYAAGSVGI